MNIQEAVSNLREAIDHIGNITGSNDVMTLLDGLSQQIWDKEKFNSIDAPMKLKERESIDYPFEAVKIVNGMRFFVLLPRHLFKIEIDHEKVMQWLRGGVDV